MIIGFGSDLCSVARIEKLMRQFNKRFLQRCFTTHEIAYAQTSPALCASRLAKRFAAKEACAKALGCGIGAAAHLKDIEIRNPAKGKPEIILSGAALATLNSLLPKKTEAKLWLTLSDDAGFALAQVIIEAVPETKDQPDG